MISIISESNCTTQEIQWDNSNCKSSFTSEMFAIGREFNDIISLVQNIAGRKLIQFQGIPIFMHFQTSEFLMQ